MSWIFGVWQHEQPLREPNTLRTFHDTALHTCSQPHFYLATGGIPETCHFTLTEGQRGTGWTVVGCGMSLTGGDARILQHADWDRIYRGGHRTSIDALHTLDGHFASVRWDPSGISFACDQLGQRTIYFCEEHGTLYFSTRLDWIARATGKCEIDLDTIGSRWLLFNQLSYRSGVQGIQRLGPAGHAHFSPGQAATTGCTPWLPSFRGGRIGEAIEIAETFVGTACNLPQKVSLGLSGGMDSRLLLAMLAPKKSGRVQAHTFGEAEDPDVVIAQAIARQTGIHQIVFDDPIPEGPECLALARSFVAETQLNEPVSSIGKLRYYRRLHADGAMMIDGGFGEIARRQYLNRVAKLGSGALRRGDVPGLLRLMCVPRAGIFTPEITQMMEQAVHNDLHQTLEAMPPVRETGIGNFVDLLAVRTRVPNYGGPEQSRLDSEILNFMPLVQPSFLRAVFASDVHSRSNGRSYTQHITMRRKDLSRFPLVKSGVTYRFGLPTLAVHVLTAAKGRFGHRYRDNSTDIILHRMEEYVRDVVASAGVRNSSYYDAARVKHAVESYYRGEPGLTGTVNWWLTFELWRASLAGR
jgi:asparagine synthetase B (glutamine-hydrolysing)